MLFHWQGPDFLQRINMDVRPHGKTVRPAPCNPHPQQEDRKLARLQRSFTFAREVDLVILGCCSSDYKLATSPPLDPNFPMGKCILKAADGSDKSWLHTVLGNHAVKHVLIIPECCGDYSERYQKFLQGIFLRFELIFPEMSNLNGNFLSRNEATIEGVEDLIAAGVLKA